MVGSISVERFLSSPEPKGSDKPAHGEEEEEEDQLDYKHNDEPQFDETQETGAGGSSDVPLDQTEPSNEEAGRGDGIQEEHETSVKDGAADEQTY